MFGFLTGWDQTMAAMNAVMANHLMETSPYEIRLKIADQVAEIMASVRRGQQKEQLLAELDREARVVQMNFVALACDNLYIDPPFKGVTWTRVKNPYLVGAQVSAERIKAALESFQKDGYRNIIWTGNDPYHFSSLYLTPSVVNSFARSQSEFQYITHTDHEMFGSDLIDLLDRIFMDTVGALTGKCQSENYVTERDGEAFGTTLITIAFKIITMKIFAETSSNLCLKNILEVYLITDQDEEDFGEDLIDLFTRSAMQNIYMRMGR